jgi:hypothetical protein
MCVSEVGECVLSLEHVRIRYHQVWYELHAQHLPSKPPGCLHAHHRVAPSIPIAERSQAANSLQHLENLLHSVPQVQVQVKSQLQVKSKLQGRCGLVSCFA